MIALERTRPRPPSLRLLFVAACLAGPVCGWAIGLVLLGRWAEAAGSLCLALCLWAWWRLLAGFGRLMRGEGS